MYSNFNGLEISYPKKILYPTTKAQLTNYIKNNKKIRVVGSKHTFNDISLTNETLINMEKLNNVINIDLNSQTVTVEAGIKLEKLLSILDNNGLTLNTMPVINQDSIAGAISTGSHGSNFDEGSISGLVKEMTLVLADGKSVLINRDLDLFNCSLGCLSAIYSLKLQCTKQYSIIETEVVEEWSKISKNLKNILEEYELTDMRVDQHSKNLLTNVTLAKKVPYDGRRGPGYTKLSSSSASWYIEIELSFPLSIAFLAVKAVAEFHKEYKKRYNVFTNSKLYIRFNKADDSILSMASHRDTIYVSTFFGKQYDANVVYEFMRRLSDEMVIKYNARPHYGKQHNLNKKQMKKLYPGYDTFLMLKNRLDPNKKFSNDYINRLF
jgi:FAD/FMN-containing dehydrogenase